MRFCGCDGLSEEFVGVSWPVAVVGDEAFVVQPCCVGVASLISDWYQIPGIVVEWWHLVVRTKTSRWLLNLRHPGCRSIELVSVYLHLIDVVAHDECFARRVKMVSWV